MEYEVEVLKKLQLVNSVLNKLGVRGIADTPCVALNESRNFPNYVEYSMRRDGAVRIDLAISSDGMQVGIDDMTEVFDWSDKQVSEETNAVAEVLEMVFSSAIEIKRCGSNYRRIRFLGEGGKCLRTCKYVSGFFLPISCRVYQYAPLLPKGGASVSGRRLADF